MCNVRIAKFYFGDEGVELEASERSSLHKLLCPSTVTEKSLWEKITRAFRSPETAHLTLAWQRASGWEMAIQWPFYRSAYMWAPEGDGTMFSSREHNAEILIGSLLRADGGEKIFTQYVEDVAAAILASGYCKANEELQSKLRVAFWDDIARPAFDKLRANKAAQDKLRKEIAEKTAEKELTEANQAASNYLAARN